MQALENGFKAARIFLAMCIVLLALAAAAGPAGAAASKGSKTFRGEYTVSILGLTVAKSSFTTRLTGDRFLIEGSLAAAGLAELFDDTKGTTTVSGVFFDESAWPRVFRTRYVSGKKEQFTEINFSRGSVTRTVNVPPLKKRGSNWVGVSERDLRAVTDPISATLIRAPSLAEVCKRRIRAFDGEMRADLVLSHSATRKVSVAGYSGPAVTCTARFVPVSGYRKGRKAIDYLKDRSAITITFAELGKTGIYAPVRATVGTQIGTLTIAAQRFEAVN